MKKTALFLLILVIAVVGYLMYQGSRSASVERSYAYECANGIHFSVTPAEDRTWVMIDPDENATFPQQVLAYQDNIDGAFYNNTSFALSGSGKSIQIKFDTATTSCNPVSDNDAYDWDANGIERDLALVLTNTIVGKWKDVERPTFVREFKTDGVYIDRVNGTESGRGLWFAFTNNNAPPVNFTLEKNNVYLQMAAGDTVEYLKVINLTPTDLSMVYMDRAGVLNYRVVQE